VIRFAPEFSLMERDSNLIEAFMLNELLGDENPLVVARLQSPANIVEHQLDRSGAALVELDEGNWEQRFWLVYAYVLILMMSSFISAGQLTQSVVNEKENRMIEVVLSSVRPFELMVGKIIGQGLAGLLQVLIWLGSIIFLIQQVGVNLSFIADTDISVGMILLLLVYFLGGYTLFAAFAAGIGAISKNMREGPQYAMIYSLPAVFPMIFLPQIVDSPNSQIAVFFSFFPLTAPLGMIERLVLTTVPGWHVALSLFLLFLGIAGAMWLAGRLFQVNSLLSGEVPGRRELMRILFGKQT
jgi:ABC-2 type transport system permease protein